MREKTDPNAPAMPWVVEGMDMSDVQTFGTGGLTKREWFAGLAMQGVLAGPDSPNFEDDSVARSAVDLADALIAALNEEEASHE